MMSTSRKLTIAASYIRSAIEDVSFSSPLLARDMKASILRPLEILRSKRPDIMGKCYNISKSL